MTIGTILRPTILAASVVLLAGILNPDSGAIQRQAVDAQPQPPATPRASVELPPDRHTGRTVHVPAGGNLQDALDKVAPGDRITLDPKARYEGPFRLRRHEGGSDPRNAKSAQWIVIASAAEAQLPRRGTRITPSNAALMPKLVASSGSVIEAMPGAHHYRFVGIEVTPADGVFLTTLVELGDNEKTVDAQPHNIVFERSYIHGDPKKGGRRGIALNSRFTAVIDSHLSDFKEAGADSQAVSGWNGAGPFRIANNYLEAAGENIMFGGADPSAQDLVPSDIEIVRNHMAKPLRWKLGHPTFEGTPWAVKNLLELKNARRVLIEGNVLERNWTHAQNGFAILFTPRNQDGGSPWSVVEDVTFVNNVVRHVGGGVNVLGKDDNHPSQQTRRIAIRNNVFLDVGGEWGNGRLFQLLDGTSDIAIENNTAIQTGSILFGGDHAPHTGFVFRNNITPHGEHGIIGSSTDVGTQSLARYFPRAVVRGNVIIGGEAGRYPTDNFFVQSIEEAGIGELRKGHLRPVRPGQFKGSDGRAPGADMDVLAKAVNGVAPLQSADSGLAGDQVTLAAAAPTSMTISPGQGLFWGSLALLVYVYLGYPVLAGVRARLKRRQPQLREIEPTVSIVVVAYNEAERIVGRIENLLALDYPRDRFEIIVGSDGSTDDTVARARRFSRAGVRVIASPERRGKAAVLNAVVPYTRGEIVVFADARQQFDPGTLRALVSNYADPRVGAVSGELVLRPAEGAPVGQGAAFYWRYEKFIRSAESRVDSTVGATGAIYSVRRSLFRSIPEDTILDDVLIPLRIVQQGYRVLFEPRAKAFDCTCRTAQHEFTRKARTIAGNFQLFARERWLFSPWRNRLWFETMSHKALRLMLPLLHVGALAGNIALAGTWPYGWLLVAQLAFYAAAMAACVQRRAGRRSVVLTVPYTICLLSWATLVGFWRFAMHRQPVTWERVAAATVSDAERSPRAEAGLAA